MARANCGRTFLNIIDIYGLLLNHSLSSIERKVNGQFRHHLRAMEESASINMSPIFSDYFLNRAWGMKDDAITATRSISTTMELIIPGCPT